MRGEGDGEGEGGNCEESIRRLENKRRTVSYIFHAKYYYLKVTRKTDFIRRTYTLYLYCRVYYTGCKCMQNAFFFLF